MLYFPNYLSFPKDDFGKDCIGSLGGGNLTCLWYGVVPFFRVLFHDSFQIYGYGFQQFFFASSGFKRIVFCQNSFIGELFWYSWIYGYDFQKFSRFMGILLRNFSGFMGGTFMI